MIDAVVEGGGFASDALGQMIGLPFVDQCADVLGNAIGLPAAGQRSHPGLCNAVAGP